MARKRIVETQLVLDLIYEFFIKECNGNPKLLKNTSIANYISEKTNTNYKYDTLRKTHEAVDYIQTLKATAEVNDFTKVSTYKTLDIDNFLNTHTTKASLKAALSELDSYYKSMADSAAIIYKKYSTYNDEILLLKEEITNKELEIDTLKNDYYTLLQEKKQLLHHNNNLTKFINDNVYPEFCNYLLQEDGLLKNNERFLKTDSITIIDANADIFSESNIIQGLFDKFKGD